MIDSRTEELARLCVHYSVDLKPNEKVLIYGSDFAFPLINAIYKECLLSDTYPLIMPRLNVEHTFFKYAKEHQLKHVSPFVKFIYENIDVVIGIFCDPNPKRLTNIDPAKIKMRAASRRELTDIGFRREAKGELRWTGLPYPISAQAQEAGMSITEYEDFVYSSCLVDKEDPLKEWKKIHEKQEKICELLNAANEIHVTGEDTDLTFNVTGRRWMNCSGKRNMPDGEVFTAPIENSARGDIRFTYPGIYSGREVEDIKLTFKEGKVVQASAAKGSELLRQILEIDGADRIGEIAIGTNYAITRFTKSMLFDEKMGGTIHLALGRTPTIETGGRNNSAVHWDILKDMREDAEIYADRTLFYKNGKFLA